MVQLSKAGMRNTLSLKAGHPPAVKAGGKRVVKKNSEDNGTLEKESKKADKPRYKAELIFLQSSSFTIVRNVSDHLLPDAANGYSNGRPPRESMFVFTHSTL
ncbi:death-associated protein-like 1 [Silurus meridionalis]|nr:death-associated protein-like 1 [Silurus meridionalis]